VPTLDDFLVEVKNASGRVMFRQEYQNEYPAVFGEPADISIVLPQK
jgi:hypothetical protein